MPKFKLMIAQFPGNYTTHQDVADYVRDLSLELAFHPEIGKGNIGAWRLTDTPITMGRNRCLVEAEEAGFDYVVMIDSDMSPDLRYSDAKPFFSTTWDFMRKHEGPCVVAAPYCGPPSVEEVYAFKWAQTETGCANPNFKVANFDRWDAAGYKGILPAAALATGLMLIDMRAVKRLPHPRFYYEWTNEKQTHKASTEDVTFSRDLYLRGVPLYVNWDAWAGHHKLKLVPRPERIPEGVVPKMLTERAEQIAIERLVKAASQVDPTTKKALSAAEFIGKYKPEAGYSEKQELAEDEDPKNISWPTTYAELKKVKKEIEDAKENGMTVRRKADSDTLVLESRPCKIPSPMMATAALTCPPCPLEEVL